MNDIFNQVQARGQIINIGRDRMAHDTVTILVVRPNKEKCFIRFALRNEIDPALKRGDRVKIEGFINAYAYKNAETDRWENVQYFIADSVVPDETKMEKVFGIPGTFYENSYFRAHLRGTIAAIGKQHDPRFVRLILRTPETKKSRSALVTLNYFVAGKFLPKREQFDRYDEICVIAGVTTPAREENGRKISQERLFIDDISLVKKGERILKEEPERAEKEVKDTPVEEKPKKRATRKKKEENTEE